MEYIFNVMNTINGKFVFEKLHSKANLGNESLDSYWINKKQQLFLENQNSIIPPPNQPLNPIYCQFQS